MSRPSPTIADREVIRILTCAADDESNGVVYVDFIFDRVRYRAEVDYYGLQRAYGVTADDAVAVLRRRMTRVVRASAERAAEDVIDAVESLDRVTRHERAMRRALAKVGAR